jgi:hypothetical protein
VSPAVRAARHPRSRGLAVVAPRLICRLGDRFGPDDQQPLHAEIQSRLDRRVQSSPAVHVPAASLDRRLHPYRWEEDGDRSRRADVFAGKRRGNVLHDMRVVQGNLAAGLDEHDRPAGTRGGRDYRNRLDEAVCDVAVKIVPIHPVFEAARKRRGVEQTGHANSRQRQESPHVTQRGERQLVREDRADHGPLGDLPPAVEQAGGLLLGAQVPARSHVGSVDRTDARAEHQRRALPARLERRHNDRDRTRLVSATSTTARKHTPNSLSCLQFASSSELPRVRRVGIECVDGRGEVMDDDIARSCQQGPHLLAVAAVVGRGVVGA